MTVRPRFRVVHGSGPSPGPGEQPRADAEILAGLESLADWAAAALYDRIHAVVERTLARVLQHRGADFEDLTQDTFERIVRTLRERRFAAGCSLATWAAAIATNVAIDALRAQTRKRRVFALDPVDTAVGVAASAHSADDRLEARAEIARLQVVLSSMRPDRAQAVFMHDLLGHNLAELAAVAGVTVAAAQSRLVRGRAEFLRKARLPAKKGPGDED